MVTGRDELAVVASGGCIYAMGGSHLVWPVPWFWRCPEILEPVLVMGLMAGKLSLRRWRDGGHGHTMFVSVINMLNLPLLFREIIPIFYCSIPLVIFH